MTALSPEIDTVIFDLDGTLRSSVPNAQIVFMDYAVQLGAPGDLTTFRQARQWAHRYWANSECLVRDLETYGREGDDFWINYARRQLTSMNVPESQAEDWAPEMNQYMSEHLDSEDVIPDDVVPTLQQLRDTGYRIGLLTNRSQPADDYLAEAGLDQHLDFWVTSGVVGTWKPGPEIFYYTLGVAGSVPARAVYIGDNYYADVVGAQGANIQPVLIDPDEVFPEAECPVIRAIGDLLPLLDLN
jgi:putative hydrolase of the HAD superfamily